MNLGSPSTDGLPRLPGDATADEIRVTLSSVGAVVIENALGPDQLARIDKLDAEANQQQTIAAARAKELESYQAAWEEQRIANIKPATWEALKPDSARAVHQILTPHVLQAEAGGTGADCLVEVLVGVVRREDENVGR